MRPEHDVPARQRDARLGIGPGNPFAGSMLPMSVLALDGTLLFVNDAVCRLLSTDSESLVDTSAMDLCSAPEDRRTVSGALSSARAGTRGGVVSYDVQIASRQVMNVQLTWTLVCDVEGQPWYISAAFREATEQAATSRAAEDESLAWRARFDLSSLPQATLDPEGRLSAVNPALCALLGRPIGALQDVDLRSVTHPATDPGADVHLTAVLSGAKQSGQFELVLAGASGGEVPVHVELTLLRDAAGRPGGAAMFLHDLRALRRHVRSRQRQNDYVDSLSRLAGDVVLVGSAAGELVYVSPATERVLGYSQEELTGVIGWDFVHPDDLGAAQSAYSSVVSDGGSRTFRLRVRQGDGSWRWLEETATNQLNTAVGGIVCNLRDVHDEVQADLSLRESEVRFRAIAETASEGIWLVTPQGRTLFANARIGAILGMPMSQVYTDPATSLLDGGDAVRMADRLAGRGARGTEHYETDFVHPGGQRLRLAIAASPLAGPEGDVVGSLAMVRDVTRERLVERELRRAALHDALTGLPNRALFLDRLEQALARGNGRTAVVFLDLDQFKLVNDHRGHDVGDQLLVAVAGRLSASVRTQDTVARFGGDEFVVLAEAVDEELAEQLGQQLRLALATPFMVEGVAVHVDASLGVALSPPSSAVDLLRYADIAMYEAKAAGRGRVRVFDPALAEAAGHRYVLAEHLRTALREHALGMEYQPILDLHSGAVIGIEALARWSDPDYGNVSPDRFVHIAETSGLAPLLDRWAIERALRDARALRRAGALSVDAYVSVNLSASNASDRGLEDFIVTSTAASGLLPANVMLEITEGAIMRDADAAIPLLRRLRARGFRLAIDDFGTGQSSLAYLRDLPVNTIKIDRSFIAGIRADSDALAIVHAVVDLGRAVGLTVIAEGVEDEGQALLLRQLGCHAAQGWLWSASLPFAEIVANQTWAAGYDVGTADRPKPPRRRRGRPEVLSEHGLDRILALHRKGASLSTIAAALNSDGYLTPAGLRWHQASVARAVSDAATAELADAAQPTARAAQ